MPYHKQTPWQLCEDLKAVINARIDKHDWNRLQCWNSAETLNHFLTKAMVFKILRSRGRTTVAEASIGVGVCDIIDLDMAYIYEIESNPTPEKEKQKYAQYNCAYIKDIIVIDLRKLPADNKERYKELERLIL